TDFRRSYAHRAQTGALAPQQVLDWTTVQPAEVFNMGDGVLVPGSDADITVIDLEKEYTLDKAAFLSKSKKTPFAGEQPTSDIYLTVVNGEIKYQAEGQ